MGEYVALRDGRFAAEHQIIQDFATKHNGKLPSCSNPNHLWEISTQLPSRDWADTIIYYVSNFLWWVPRVGTYALEQTNLRARDFILCPTKEAATRKFVDDTDRKVFFVQTAQMYRGFRTASEQSVIEGVSSRPELLLQVLHTELYQRFLFGAQLDGDHDLMADKIQLYDFLEAYEQAVDESGGKPNQSIIAFYSLMQDGVDRRTVQEALATTQSFVDQIRRDIRKNYEAMDQVEEMFPLLAKNPRFAHLFERDLGMVVLREYGDLEKSKQLPKTSDIEDLRKRKNICLNLLYSKMNYGPNFASRFPNAGKDFRRLIVALFIQEEIPSVLLSDDTVWGTAWGLVQQLDQAAWHGSNTVSDQIPHYDDKASWVDPLFDELKRIGKEEWDAMVESTARALYPDSKIPRTAYQAL